MIQISEIIINFNSISIPEYLLYESDIGDFDLILDWIRYRKNELVPKELKYLGWKTDKDDYSGTPLMYWIKHRKNEPIRDGSLEQRSCIPEELFYTNWQTDKNGYEETPLILWIKYRKNEPVPEELNQN